MVFEAIKAGIRAPMFKVVNEAEHLIHLEKHAEVVKELEGFAERLRGKGEWREGDERHGR